MELRPNQILVKETVDNLSDLIRASKLLLEVEMVTSVQGPDESDYKIRILDIRVKTLRGLRTAFEDLMYQSTHPGF